MTKDPDKTQPLVTAKYVMTITVVDPDSNMSVDIAIYKEEGGGMFGVDESYIEQEVDAVYSPFGNGELFLGEE